MVEYIINVVLIAITLLVLFSSSKATAVIPVTSALTPMPDLRLNSR